MKRVIAVSDSHGMEQRLRNVLFAIQEKSPADVVVFLGDGLREWETVSQELRLAHPGIKLYGVKGNNDMTAFGPDLAEFKVNGVTFIACHGHRYGVKITLDRLEVEAVSREAKVALYGHTHIADITNYFSCCFVNPGSISGWGSFAPVAAEVLVDEKQKVCARIINADEIGL
ncbi:MAG: YfcE family phosphodiesterase [Clostridiales bacterium]|nr:YfcE family phosphodiesterase [Clostridiales bacterium]